MFTEHKEQGEVTELDEASKVLLKAADVLEEYGWCQNHLETYDGLMCANGALWIAAGRPSSRDENQTNRFAFNTAQDRLSASLGCDIVVWNDRPTNTQKQVVAKLRAVALGL